MRRFKHNLSHYHLTSGSMGSLIPISWTEVLPRDAFRFSSSVVLRAQPLLAPVMHPISVRLHFFFVPNRIIDEAWEDFITNAAESSPNITTNWVGNSLQDYLGLDPDADAGSIWSYPQKAYTAIFKEYYRDQQITAEPGSDVLRRIAWEKDFLTTARPFPQRDSFIAQAPVKGAGGDEYVDALDIRQALAQQRYQEARSRYGNRYVEYLQYLGANPGDARLQRPEYLGGGVGRIQFSEVVSTVETAEDPQGTLKGHGIASVRTPVYQKEFNEHGIFMTMLSMRPKALYVDGLDKEFGRLTDNDPDRTGFRAFWQKEFEHTGQVPVKYKEIKVQGDFENDENTWGWQDRYYEYRRRLSRVSREMRDIFDYWHLGRKWAAAPPGLNDSFIQVNEATTKRIFADQVSDSFQIASNHMIKARRLVAPKMNPRAL